MSMTEYRPAGSPSFYEAVPQGQPIVETPLQELARNHLVITQAYMQHIDGYTKPAENALIPREILPQLGVIAYHCYDTARVPVQGSKIVTFDRVWASIPPSFEDPEAFTISMQMPSYAAVRKCGTYYSNAYGITITYRITNLGILTKGNQANYQAKTKRDFYLIGQKGSYANTGAIPQNNEQIYTYRDWSQLATNVEYDSGVWDGLVAALPVQSVGLTAGVIFFADYSQQLSLAANQTVCATLQGYASIAGYRVVGKSKLVRYIGNIWERRSVGITI